MNLEELKAAYAASTQGEWEQVGYNDIGRYVQTLEAGEICSMKRGKWKQIKNNEYQANAQFIALAHNAMPMLLEAVELLKESRSYLGCDPEVDELLEKLKENNLCDLADRRDAEDEERRMEG